MTSTKSSTSCAVPPTSLLVEKPYERILPQIDEEEKQDTSPTSSSASNLKTFTPRTRRALEGHLCSSNSAVVSSVDAHTPPTGPHKPNPAKSTESAVKKYIKRKWNIDAYVNQPDEYHEPDTIHRSQFNVALDGKPPLELRQEWDFNFPYPCNEYYPENDVFNFTPKVIAEEIDPEVPFALHRWHSEFNFLEPLAIEGDIRQEYAAHAAYEKHHYDLAVKRFNDKRRVAAEQEALKTNDFEPRTKPTEFPMVPPKSQREFYNAKVDVAALTRKVAIHDGSAEGLIAGEFTYYPDTSHLPPTEHQKAVLREAESLRGLFPSTPTTKLSMYDQWLKDQESNICPPSSWLDEEAAFAKKQAFREAYSKQLKFHFAPPKTPKIDELPKVLDADELEWETDYFPYHLPETRNDPEHHNMYETPLKADVPKWFPTFASYGIIHLNRRNTVDKQYKEFLTTVWKLESRVRSTRDSKPNKWDKKWHDPSHHWAEPFQKSSGQSWDIFDPNMPRDLVEQDVVSGEFSFDDVFDMDGNDGTKTTDRKKPEDHLMDIEERCEEGYREGWQVNMEPNLRGNEGG
ncbi:hypothetical protein F53441_996 [Fusarium austroafricanum]|uniref:Uncharacterized protein n=1 Tax=Fusarium austroafricanum TaxID=2364996 RepID=A0A8H4KUI4_9HYPO|nr:hypothetical protein F53441_996 [Fusarium austroafricanum]